jgi:outer membrane lipoprotein SlyB
MKPTAPGPTAPRVALFTLALLLSACATHQPVVYQAQAPSAAQAQRLERDTLECRQRAEQRVGLNARRAPASQAGRGVPGAADHSARAGVIGFVAAAANGLVAGSRDVWNRARAGAAAGATGVAAKTLLEWNDPDKVYLEYVERCMDERGHEVLGWR